MCEIVKNDSCSHLNFVTFLKMGTEGYDSDVAREKTVDYTTKMYAISIREMRGTKPHQQVKELSAEERYTHTHTHSITMTTG